MIEIMSWLEMACARRTANKDSAEVTADLGEVGIEAERGVRR